MCVRAAQSASDVSISKVNFAHACSIGPVSFYIALDLNERSRVSSLPLRLILTSRLRQWLNEADERGISGWLRLTWRQALRVRLPELNDYCVIHIGAGREKDRRRNVERKKIVSKERLEKRYFGKLIKIFFICMYIDKIVFFSDIFLRIKINKEY